jgi:hypothetical protein
VGAGTCGAGKERAVSPRTVYVGGIDLVALRRDRSTGALALAACAAPAASRAHTCAGPRLARDAIGGIALSPDGRSAYAANFSGNELSGVATPLGTGGSAACLASFALRGCRCQIR